MGGPDHAFPHSRSAPFFFTRILLPELLSLLCWTFSIFAKRSASRAQILANPTSRGAVKFRIPFHVSRITHCILVISRIQRIAFQTRFMYFIVRSIVIIIMNRSLRSKASLILTPRRIANLCNS